MRDFISGENKESGVTPPDTNKRSRSVNKVHRFLDLRQLWVDNNLSVPELRNTQNRQMVEIKMFHI